MDRSKQFERWLIDLSPEKVNILKELEKSSRLLTHVKRLTGDTDEKLVQKLCQIVDALRDNYERPEKSTESNLQPE